MIPVQNISYESLSFEFPYLELCLVHAGLAAGQLGYGDGHKDHQQAGGQILVLCLTLQSKKVLKKMGIITNNRSMTGVTLGVCLSVVSRAGSTLLE